MQVGMQKRYPAFMTDPGDHKKQESRTQRSDDTIEGREHDVVPVAFCTTRKKSDSQDSPETLKPYSFDELKGQEVEMWVSGFWAKGKLVGVDEESVYLRGLHRWWVYPLERVSQLRPLNADRTFTGNAQQWDPDPDPKP